MWFPLWLAYRCRQNWVLDPLERQRPSGIAWLAPQWAGLGLALPLRWIDSTNWLLRLVSSLAALGASCSSGSNTTYDLHRPPSPSSVRHTIGILFGTGAFG